MTRAFACAALTVVSSAITFGQSGETLKFELADVHVSAKSTNPFIRMSPVRAGRYEVKTATMVDLIRVAYGFDQDKILGGPNWLEMDRFDVIAKVPADSPPDGQKAMLQALLEDRFKLKLHKDTKPLPTFALTVGKKLQIKEADGSGETGCNPQSASGPPTEGGGRLMMANQNGTTTTINFGPGGTIQYLCRNVTMAAFAEGLRRMIGASVGTNPILEETGLKGNWSFDLKYSIQMNGGIGGNEDRLSIFDALDKQLGLKLETRQVPTPVIVVDSVDEKPSANPPGVAEALPVIPAPTEFEVADIKLADPSVPMRRFQLQPGGRLTIQGMPIRTLVYRAFNTNNGDQVAGLPKFVDTERYDIIAKAPAAGPAAPALDMDSVAPMVRALLADRFKMTYHMEERPVSAYSLAAGKPKMKRADPASRTSCKFPNPPPGSPPATRVLSCQNVTMAQFAERLQGMTPELMSPVLDATGIDGGWDVTLTFSFVMFNGGGRGGDAGAMGNNLPTASDPTGALTIFEAMEKQLGLKLELQKRPMQVFVIDHIEQKPTEN
jgi:uncharacterized protein (TIGR03435 family)